MSYNLKFRLRTDFNIAIANQLKRAGFYTLMRQGNQNNIFSCNKLPIISGKSGEFREEIIDFIKEQIYQNKFMIILNMFMVMQFKKQLIM